MTQLPNELPPACSMSFRLSADKKYSVPLRVEVLHIIIIISIDIMIPIITVYGVLSFCISRGELVTRTENAS